MENITIDEFINGYGVRWYDGKAGKYILSEFHEKLSDALMAVARIAQKRGEQNETTV